MLRGFASGRVRKKAQTKFQWGHLHGPTRAAFSLTELLVALVITSIAVLGLAKGAGNGFQTMRDVQNQVKSIQDKAWILRGIDCSLTAAALGSGKTCPSTGTIDIVQNAAITLIAKSGTNISGYSYQAKCTHVSGSNINRGFKIDIFRKKTSEPPTAYKSLFKGGQEALKITCMP